MLLNATAAGFIASGGRGRVAETLAVGVGCIVAYLVGWRSGRWLAVLVSASFLLLERHYGRFDHARYWQYIALALAGGGAVLASAFLRRAVDARGLHSDLARERVERDRVFDAIDEKLGLEARLDAVSFELERARRHNHPLTLIRLRPDEFDELKLQFGEEAGEMTLELVAVAVNRSLRATDIPSRESPFDFLLVLPETRREDARIVAERIRLSMSERRLEFGPGDIVNPTVSLGLASFPHDATTTDEIKDAALRALQGAIQSGGNRTMLFSLPEGSPSGWGLTHERSSL